MFNIFKSRREKIKEQGIKILNHIIPTIQGMNTEQIAYTLDFAKRIKMSTTMYGEHKDDLILFEDPSLLGEDEAFDNIVIWDSHVATLIQDGSLESSDKAGALLIWYVSVLTNCIPELRFEGIKMWRELDRGFSNCEYFNPAEDIPKSFRDYKDKRGSEQ